MNSMNEARSLVSRGLSLFSSPTVLTVWPATQRAGGTRQQTSADVSRRQQTSADVSRFRSISFVRFCSFDFVRSLRAAM